jgi:hypothetical protein
MTRSGLREWESTQRQTALGAVESGRVRRGGSTHRVPQLLEDAQVKLSVVASDIFGGVSAGRCWPRSSRASAPECSRSWHPAGCVPSAASWRRRSPDFHDHHVFLLARMWPGWLCSTLTSRSSTTSSRS